jgi:predicted small metal-binding protein
MKKVEMEKVLRCADVSGTSCQFVARAQTLDEILQLAGRHAVESHGLSVTPELVEAVKARIPRRRPRRFHSSTEADPEGTKKGIDRVLLPR